MSTVSFQPPLLHFSPDNDNSSQRTTKPCFIRFFFFYPNPTRTQGTAMNTPGVVQITWREPSVIRNKSEHGEFHIVLQNIQGPGPPLARVLCNRHIVHWIRPATRLVSSGVCYSGPGRLRLSEFVSFKGLGGGGAVLKEREKDLG